ncbi:uncharacterized protein LOC135400493 [Ornithodoros turicata]|uniref:uncharacterized protein LOC135400493 n=1 Tax=Ornithodoros turicata TaxID=34597 RepID=UPI003138EFC1
MENGPVGINKEGELYKRNNSLYEDYDILYLDQPVGAGFSFPDNVTAYPTSLEDIASDMEKFLCLFFKIFKGYYNRDLYIAGESYGVTGRNGLTLSNSKEFVRLIQDQVVDDNDIMVSFDVVSLFTNVPTALAVKVAEARLRDDSTLPTRTSLTVEDIIILLRFCLNQSHFSFRGQVYHQIEGCPMGSPVSVTMANLVMEYVEESAFQRFTHNIKFYRRYVDDTFVILNRNLLDEFHSTLNSIEPSIQFTCELE